MDEKTWDWLKTNISDNEMFLDLFINNPFEHFGGKTVAEYAKLYGWNSVIEVLEQR